MADGRGGRISPDGRPKAPAGPGRFSQRTDLSAPATPQGSYVPPGQPYGERQRLEQAQQVAPAPNRRTRPGAGPRGGVAAPQAIGNPRDLINFLAYPSERPDEPVTFGAERPQPSQAGIVLSYLASLPTATPAVRRLALEADRDARF